MLYHPSYSPDQTLVKYSLFPNWNLTWKVRISSTW
jgi:hypothetical protein